MQKKADTGKKHAREDNLWPSRWKNIVNHDLRLFLLFEEILNVSVGSQVSQFAAPNALIRTMWKTQYFYCPPFLYISSWGEKWLLSKSGLTTIYECWLNSLCNNGQAHHKTTTTTIGNNIADQYQTMQVMPLNTRVRLKILGYYEISSVIWNILWTHVLKQFNIWPHLWTVSWII